jgi:hypothetical protein
LGHDRYGVVMKKMTVDSGWEIFKCLKKKWLESMKHGPDHVLILEPTAIEIFNNPVHLCARGITIIPLHKPPCRSLEPGETKYTQEMVMNSMCTQIFRSAVLQNYTELY